MRKECSIVLFGLVLALFVGQSHAAQNVTKTKAQSAESPLRVRVETFYNYILRGERVAALEMVDPESRNQFLNNRYNGLTAFRIVGYDFDDNGDRATIKVVRVTKVPGVGQPLDLTFNETWQRTNGQWYLVLPSSDEIETPFGRFTVNRHNQQTTADEEAMKRKIEQRYKNVDPEQYLRALQKVASKPVTESKPAPESKPENKQEQPKPSPDATGAKPEPQR